MGVTGPRHLAGRATSPLPQEINIHVDEVVVDGPSNDPIATTGAVELAIERWFAQDRIARALPRWDVLSEIDVGTLDGGAEGHSGRDASP